MNDDFVPKLAKKVRVRADGPTGKTMLVYPERGLLLSETAAAIATRCDGTRTLVAIAAEVAAQFGAREGEHERVLADVRELVRDLRDRALLEP